MIFSNYKLILIGGSNIDFIATSLKPIIEGTSNIGKLKISFGGVMKNVAYDLSILNDDFLFFTAIGNDLYGKKLKEDLKEASINYISPKSNRISSTYLAINNEKNDLYVSVCDNQIIDCISPFFLSKYQKILKNSEYICLDANLSDETIKYIFNNYNDKKIMVEGVSIPKIVKLKNYLDKIYLLKCNIGEAKALLAKNVSFDDVANKLIEKGVKKFIISNKDNPVIGYNGSHVETYTVDRIENIINCNGAGDALFAGFVHYFMKNEDFEGAVKFGIKLSRYVLQSEESYSLESKELVLKK